MKKLLDELHIYTYDAFNEDSINECLGKIKNLISAEAPFTAFKISFIKKHYQDDERILSMI
ncbi:MAG: hypothetical protein ACI86M_000855 [Saprospiraceae bacterium]|jgi:hypothetical protein